MPLQITKRAVVRDQLEAIVGALEGPTRTVPSVAPVADVGPQERHPVVVPELAHPPLGLALRAIHGGKTRRHQHLLLAVGIEVQEGHLVDAAGLVTEVGLLGSGQRRRTSASVW